MGWFSLVTKVVPTLWRGGAKVTSTLWHGGGAVTSAGGKVVSAVAKNPKTTVVRGGVEGTGSFAHDAVNGFTGENTVEQVKDTATSIVSDLQGAATETRGLLGTIGDTLRGISSFLGNLFGGNGTNMFGNFLNNLTSGKISGWGIGALIAASYMIFGRTGLLGKIGGMMMAMMMIGNNSQRQTQTASLAQEPSHEQSQEQPRNLHR